ncbi:hypothetical protein PAECIP112173_02431 [Paenibacillus sp. JJ-100]|uniref:hypothetical protein n=1 Tax=Paenibacillus sp. JJ-100 TaxID=2974896 RepID=UPI0022FF6171|nr:hypothetical protein [Paenibacillus sp. JJ-100]CAI6076521.1 hypothetical protein PAECIP112173_02431 [Paenibacillus sp. JJ-100]
MKSKRAMIDRRNAERRTRREQKRNPPGPFSKLFDWGWKTIYVLFFLSLAVVAFCHWFLRTGSGPGGTSLIAYTAERMATFMLFVMLATACVVGIRAMMKSTGHSSSGDYQHPNGKRLLLLKIILFLFFAIVFAVSALICWAQLKALAEVLRFLLS